VHPLRDVSACIRRHQVFDLPPLCAVPSVPSMLPVRRAKRCPSRVFIVLNVCIPNPLPLIQVCEAAGARTGGGERRAGCLHGFGHRAVAQRLSTLLRMMLSMT